MRNRAFVSVIASLFALPIFAQQTPIQFCDIDGHKMEYQVAGRSGPVIVFENGHASTLETWDDIFFDVAKFARVIRYNRLGYGRSEPSDKPRTFKQIATELHQMLRAAKIAPPYILVGHSMGGATIRAFASLYKDETAGMVLVDPFNEFEAGGMDRQTLAAELAHMDSTMRTLPPAYAAEFHMMSDELTSGFPSMNSFGAPPDVPTVLLVAGKNRPPGWEKNGIDFFESKLRGLSDVQMILMPQTPHYMQAVEAATVTESIRRVMFPNAEVILRRTLKEKGLDSCITQYKKIKGTYPKDFVRERLLNTLGYDALGSGNVKEAITLFRMNVAAYPESYNVYDSLGEAYTAAGNKTEAIKNYEKSLRMNPSNVNAEKMLKKLKAG
jgi:pimeloyl-ACP methyl ester carboxylesterase